MLQVFSLCLHRHRGNGRGQTWPEISQNCTMIPCSLYRNIFSEKSKPTVLRTWLLNRPSTNCRIYVVLPLPDSPTTITYKGNQEDSTFTSFSEVKGG